MFASIDDLRHRFELSKSAHAYRLNFNEYALLYRLYEGMQQTDVPESLFLSQPTISRCRKRLIKKFRASSFSQLLLKLGAMHILEELAG